jgi:isopentenyl-diphosphate Delta-isomerase
MDTLILVDSEDNVVGYEEKEECHLIPTKLHRAFSIFIINPKGEMLIHKRSSLKKTWPGFWTNACCSHPRKAESLEEATEKRLRFEMGFSCPLEYLFRFEYKTDYNGIYGENEVDHVFYGLYDGRPYPNSDEVEDWKFMGLSGLSEDVEKHGRIYTPWFKIALPRVIDYIQQANKSR